MPNLRSRRISGNLAFWSTHQKRILDATGEGVVKYIDDFTSFPVDDTTGDPVAWTSTMVEAGSGNTTIASTDKSGGAVIITTAGNEDDGGNFQLNGESFKTDGNELYFGSVDGSASLSAVTESGSTETQSDSVGTLVDDTDIELEFYYNGSNVEFFVDGSSVATSSTNIPSTEMRVSVHFLTGEATANTCTIDWIRAIQMGR
jgi:hypothetical protein